MIKQMLLICSLLFIFGCSNNYVSDEVINKLVDRSIKYCSDKGGYHDFIGFKTDKGYAVILFCGNGQNTIIREDT